jgi:hypothetical protein
MNTNFSRRSFLVHSAKAGLAFGLGDVVFNVRPVSAAESKMPASYVQFRPEIEPLVRLLEDTPRERVLEEFAARIHQGTSYREVLTALLLAGVRNIQPRPVGFKFHAVLVVNSAHIASLNSPDADRWLPIFWALDQFKSSQARDVQEGDWTMSAVDESAVPPSHRVKAAFIEAIENWDVAATDVAVAGLARTLGQQEVFELFAKYGSRDFRDLGHKAIYVANSWRTLQNIGWQHAEPVLRSLAYALLEHKEGNPAASDAAPDRPGRRNQELIVKIRPDWLVGKVDSGGSQEMLRALRQADAASAAEQTVELLNRGVSPASVWDGIFQGAAELLIREPGIVALHSFTTSNAIHYAWQHCSQDQTRRWLLLQAASFLTLFRDQIKSESKETIDGLEPLTSQASASETLAEIFDQVGHDRHAAARKALGYFRAGASASDFMHAARRLIYLKGTDSHDYKFSEAALEDYSHLAPEVRDRYLASTLFYLRGSGLPDNALVARTREALRT